MDDGVGDDVGAGDDLVGLGVRPGDDLAGLGAECRCAGAGERRLAALCVPALWVVADGRGIVVTP